MKNKQTASLEDAQTEAIKKYLDNFAASDPVFAVKYHQSKRTIKDCMSYITEIVRKCVKSGTRSVMIEDAAVYGLAVHFYDEGSELDATPESTSAVEEEVEVEDEDTPTMEPVATEEVSNEVLLSAAIQMKKLVISSTALSLDQIMQ